MDPIAIQLILQDYSIVYAITDRNLNVVEVGGAISSNLNNSRQSWLGRSLLDLVPELLGNETVLADILAGELPRFQLTWVNRETAEGQTIYLMMVELPYQAQNGQITGLIHLVSDVTEMGLLEQKLVQQRNELTLLGEQLQRQNLELAAANAELRHLDDLKSTFVSVAAHELRSPLGSISGFVEILLEEDFAPLAKNQRDFLQIIQRSAHRLVAITNNLLDVTRIETGRVDLLLQPTNLPALVESIAEEIKPQLETKAQSLVLQTTPNLPLALCDETRVSQIIINLLSNANKYTLQGGLITVNITLAEEEGYLQISVQDTGVGIAPQDQDKLFSRFFRAGSATLTEATGAGLGLNITRSLVELHNGRIWFESELNKGSVFYITLPTADFPTISSSP